MVVVVVIEVCGDGDSDVFGCCIGGGCGGGDPRLLV